MTDQCIQQEAICYQWFKQRLILSVSKPSISRRSQIKEDTVEPSVPAREFNLKAYAAITWHSDPASLSLELRLADHRSQAARTATLPIAPPEQAWPWTTLTQYVTQYVVLCRANTHFRLVSFEFYSLFSFNSRYDKRQTVTVRTCRTCSSRKMRSAMEMVAR